jgi:hypothetical protein
MPRQDLDTLYPHIDRWLTRGERRVTSGRGSRVVESAAADLENIRSALTSANAAPAGPTTGLVAAGADEVSTAVALFAGYGQDFLALSAQASAFHQQFVHASIAAVCIYGGKPPISSPPSWQAATATS